VKIKSVEKIELRMKNESKDSITTKIVFYKGFIYYSSWNFVKIKSVEKLFSKTRIFHPSKFSPISSTFSIYPIFWSFNPL